MVSLSLTRHLATHVVLVCFMLHPLCVLLIPNTAELMIGEIISLSRRLGEKTMEMHKGTWNKSAKGCKEIRGKTLGIVGYGHIGSQLSVLAEGMGMQVRSHSDSDHILISIGYLL